MSEQLPINPDVHERLVVGLIQFIEAESSGSARFAVSNAYLAVDNFFTALLIEHGFIPTYNHKRKLEQVLTHFPTLIETALTSRDSVERFYEEWQRVRYTNALPTPYAAMRLVRLAYRLTSEMLIILAERWSIPPEDLTESLYAEAVGSQWTKYQELCEEFAEARRWHVEMEAEANPNASKLGAKLLDATNFVFIRALAEDPITRELVANNEEVGQHIATIYQEFLKLVDFVSIVRYGQMEDPPTGEYPNFGLSINIGYRGQSVKETVEDFMRLVTESDQRREQGESGSGYRT